MAPKYLRISELKSGTKVEACFLLQNFQVRPKKDGSNFVTLALRDATGKITGVMWDNFDPLISGTIRENDYVEASGEILTYNNQLQFKVAKIVKVSDEQVDASYFLPTTPVPFAELEASLWELIGQIQDEDLRKLIDQIFTNPSFMERFRLAPSAVSMHQAYIGGLLEHTLCVVRNALRFAENYPQANRSLLIAAGLLHDIGKIVEFVYDKKIAYSDVGRLLGHIAIGHTMVEMHCAKIDGFPPAKKVLLQHMILSHHGELEYGSPKRPKTLEALILHHADQLDAQISNYLEYAANAVRNGTRWEYSNMFERYIFGAGEEIQGAELMGELANSLSVGREESFAQGCLESVPSDDLLQRLEKDLKL